MHDTFYETLGVERDAAPDQIRAAYRRLVLKYHPDQAGASADVKLFLEVTKAYEVLSDQERRKEYDRLLGLRSKPKIPTRNPDSATKDPKPPSTRTSAPRHPPRQDPVAQRKQVAEELSRLIRLYGKGSFGDAERLARQIIQRDPQQPTPYAVLGDLARGKGDIAEAAKMYAFAAQMDPRNPMYQRKHEELVAKLSPQARTFEEREVRSGMSPLVSFGLVIIAGAYVALAHEPAAFRSMSWISTWTFGLIVMLFLAGVAAGAGLSLGGFLDRFEALSSNSLNRVSPALALASIALVNFWASILLYALIGARERSYTYSVTRLFLFVALALMVVAGGAHLSDRIDPLQVLAWGGNLVYVGAVCGWMVADALRD